MTRDRWLTPSDQEADRIAGDDSIPGPWHVVRHGRNDDTPSVTMCGLRAHGGWWRDPVKIDRDRWPTCVVCDDLDGRENALEYGRISAQMDQSEAATSGAIQNEEGVSDAGT